MINLSRASLSINLLESKTRFVDSTYENIKKNNNEMRFAENNNNKKCMMSLLKYYIPVKPVQVFSGHFASPQCSI